MANLEKAEAHFRNCPPSQSTAEDINVKNKK